MPQYISPDIVRTCRLCGEEFHPTARRQFCCNKLKSRKCVVCGKEFQTKCNTEQNKVTCSKKCAAELIRQHRVDSASSTLQRCEWCGELFQPKSSRDKYCSNKHFQTCVVCGRSFEIDVRRDKTVKTCSKECRYKLSKSNVDMDHMVSSLKSTLESKYGVDNAIKLPSTIDKLKSTNLNKYGKEWFTQTDEYKSAVAQTSLEKYGVDHFLSSETVKSKRRETCLDKYGVDNVSKLKSVQDKIVSNWIDKYGTINVSQNHILDINKWNRFIENPRKYILDEFEDAPTISELAIHFGVCLTSIYNHIQLSEITDVLSRCSSRLESQVVEKILQINPNIKIIRNDRTLIKPYEIDIYLPEYNIGIECNPTATHNSSLPDPWGGDPKHNNYHQLKSKMCLDRGIRLIHVFGYDWMHKHDIIVSMIRNSLMQSDDKIYARKCIVKEVLDDECHVFLESNHRQGYSSSSIRLGLYYDDELVSLMTFGKPRMSISKTKDGDVDYELIRFCNKLNTSVVGGASRLFKYFIHMYSPSSIISYSDFARTSGGLYKTLGFKFVRLSEPGYVWVDTHTDIAYNRMHAQKQNIQKFLRCDDIDLTCTEDEIMISHGFVKVYDSGNLVWVWNS